MLQALYLSLDETTTGHSAYISRYHNTIVFHYMLFVYIRVYIVLCYIFFLERYLRYFLYNSGRPNFLLKIFYPFFPFYRITRMNHKRYRIIYSSSKESYLLFLIPFYDLSRFVSLCCHVKLLKLNTTRIYSRIAYADSTICLHQVLPPLHRTDLFNYLRIHAAPHCVYG